MLLSERHGDTLGFSVAGGAGCPLLRGGKCKSIEEVTEGTKRSSVDRSRTRRVHSDFTRRDRRQDFGILWGKLGVAGAGNGHSFLALGQWPLYAATCMPSVSVMRRVEYCTADKALFDFSWDTAGLADGQ